MNTTCKCQSCNGDIEFDPVDFQESNRIGNMVFGQTVLCPHCNQETSVYFVDNEDQGRVPEPANAIKAPESEKPVEPIFFKDRGIMVTKSRFIIGTKTIAMRGLVSVDVAENDEVVKQFSGPKILGFAAGLGLIGTGFGMGISNDWDGYSVPLLYCIIIGAIIILISIAFTLKFKKSFAIILKTSSGEINAYMSFDRAQISNIVKALNESIISQG